MDGRDDGESNADEDDADNEFIFLLDRSSSMKGEPIEDLKRTLAALIPKLATLKGCRFNFIAFGSTSFRLFVDR
jgi:uncharacterized protein YegL